MRRALNFTEAEVEMFNFAKFSYIVALSAMLFFIAETPSVASMMGISGAAQGLAPAPSRSMNLNSPIVTPN